MKFVSSVKPANTEAHVFIHLALGGGHGMLIHSAPSCVEPVDPLAGEGAPYSEKRRVYHFEYSSPAMQAQTRRLDRGGLQTSGQSSVVIGMRKFKAAGSVTSRGVRASAAP
eukprot:1157755-Pelagomonas_calceolata.AAC.9